MSKIESLYGTTPAEIFESGLENLAEIEAVAVWAFNAMDVPGAELAEIDALAEDMGINLWAQSSEGV